MKAPYLDGTQRRTRADKRDALIAFPFIGLLILAALLTDSWLASVGLVIVPAMLGLLVLLYRFASRKEAESPRRQVARSAAQGLIGMVGYSALAVGVLLLVTKGM